MFRATSSVLHFVLRRFSRGYKVAQYFRYARWGALAVLPITAAVFAVTAAAQQAMPPSPPAPQVSSASSTPPPIRLQETVVVLGTPEPVSLGESSRAGMMLPLAPEQLLVPQFTDVLRTDSSVDLQARGAAVQTDVSIRGGSFEQTLVLLNGLRLNDAETSHFNLDVPVPLDGLGGLEVLHGAGSTLYGSDAISGVVNVATAVPTETSLRVRGAVGSYGINTQSVVATAAKKSWTEALGGSRDFSTGFLADRDYRSEQAYSETRPHSALGETDVLFAGSDRAFGANGFYGPYPSFERTKGWFASLRQQLGEKTDAMVAYRRHTDRFVLLRANPGYYTNQHTDESWEALLRRRDRFGSHVHLATGLEEDLDAIQSNNLGHHARNRGAGYVQGEWSGARGNLSLGGRDEVLSGGRNVFSPSVAGAVFTGTAFKVRGAIGYGFRLPTYTDLYYSDPTTTGNPSLRPEHAWNYEAGVDWFARPHLMISATGFTSPQSDAIDYTRGSAASKWMATNLNGFRYSGVETALRWQPGGGRELCVGWTYIAGAANVLGGLQSEYVFHYPVHNASAEWSGPMGHGFSARARLGVTQRVGLAAYPVLDTSITRTFARRFEPYLQMTNLANTGYEEIGGVRMQGRAFTGGVSVQLSRRR